MKCKRKIMVGIAFVAVVLCILFQSNTFGRKTVSYTHLDVYKRQAHVYVWWASSQIFLCSRADLLIHVVQIRKGMDGFYLFFSFCFITLVR